MKIRARGVTALTGTRARFHCRGYSVFFDVDSEPEPELVWSMMAVQRSAGEPRIDQLRTR